MMGIDWLTLTVQVCLVLVSILALAVSVWRIIVERRKATMGHRVEVIQRFYRYMVDIDWFQCRHDHSRGGETVVIEKDDYSRFRTEMYLFMLAFVGDTQMESLFDQFNQRQAVKTFDELMNSALRLVDAKHQVWLNPSITPDQYDEIKRQCAICSSNGARSE